MDDKEYNENIEEIKKNFKLMEECNETLIKLKKIQDAESKI